MSKSVETVSGYPARYDAETVIFGPKLSYSVIAKEELSSVQEAKKLARKVSVDVSVFDQTGCASAHNLFVEKGGAVSPEKFCEILNEWIYLAVLRFNVGVKRIYDIVLLIQHHCSDPDRFRHS